MLLYMHIFVSFIKYNIHHNEKKSEFLKNNELKQKRNNNTKEVT